MPARKPRKSNGRANGHDGPPLFRIGRSRTGLGLFATEPIRKGTYIVEYLGPLLTNQQCDEIPDNRYLFEVNARWTIDGKARSNVARYINHSCRGNADPVIRDRRIRIKACDKCREKRRQERAEVRAANARKRKRAARKLELQAAERSQSPR